MFITETPAFCKRKIGSGTSRAVPGFRWKGRRALRYTVTETETGKQATLAGLADEDHPVAASPIPGRVRFARKAIAWLWLIPLLLSACGVRQIPVSAPYPVPPETLAQTARSQVGAPYRWGGASPDSGFDCSGLVHWVYAQHGVRLPRITRDQVLTGSKVRRGRLQSGDLVFFEIKKDKKWLSFLEKGDLHVGIYTFNDRFVHAPSSGKHVREDALSNVFWDRHYHQARRILPTR